MAVDLGLPRRRIQKLLDAGAPDANDDDANRDWEAWTRTWRSWIYHSPRWRSLTRRLRPPADPDAGHTSIIAPAAPTAGLGELSVLDQEKVLKAKADRERAELALSRDRGQVIPRDKALDALKAALGTMLASLNELPGRLAAEFPLELRDQVRTAAAKVALADRDRLEKNVRLIWRARVPELLLTKESP